MIVGWLVVAILISILISNLFVCLYVINLKFSVYERFSLVSQKNVTAVKN